MSVKVVHKLFVIVLCIGVVLVWVAVFSLPSSRLRVVFCDVGQGDATLVSLGAFQALVDGGPGSRVIECLSSHLPFWDRSVELVILTHPQADHMDGLVEVLRRYKVSHVIVNGELNVTEGFQAFRNALSAERAEVQVLKQGDVIKHGELSFSILWPEEPSKNITEYFTKQPGEANRTQFQEEEVNEGSLVTQVIYGEFDVIITGDIGIDAERSIKSIGFLRNVEVLKVSHHGSRYSSSKEFLETVKPEVAVISVGGNNRFGHPTQETLERLNNVGAKIHRTDQEGSLVVESDGKDYWVK